MISEESWTALARKKERDWWSIDLESEEKELEVRCPWTVTKGDSMDPEGEVNHTVRRRNAIEGEEMLVKLKEHEMEVELEVDAGVPQSKEC